MGNLDNRIQNSSENPKFKLIRGGLSETSFTSYRLFVSADITDTRLMGVVGLHIRWKLPQNIHFTEYHQFYYFDAEELGFDSFESVLSACDGSEIPIIDEIDSRMTGGLGGQRVNVSEKEAKHLIQEYSSLSHKLGLPLPGDVNEYIDMMYPTVDLSELELAILNGKQCTPIKNYRQAINYFIMRCTGRDFKGAKLLTKGYVRTDIFKEHKTAALIQNRISPAPDQYTGSNSSYLKTNFDSRFDTFKTRKTYRNTSIIEYDDKFYVNVSLVTLEALKVVEYQRINTFRVTDTEVAFSTKKEEFISTYIIDEACDKPFLDRSTALTSKAMIVQHESGKLYMIFHPNNEHVSRDIFNLNDDILGLYYVLPNGQIVLCAYSEDAIDMLETDLLTSEYGPYADITGRYQFENPAFYEFVLSGIDDFDEYLDLMAVYIDPDDWDD